MDDGPPHLAEGRIRCDKGNTPAISGGGNGRVRCPLGSLKEVSNNGPRYAAKSTAKEMAIGPGARTSRPDDARPVRDLHGG
jgi:hypothetical protein